MTENLHALVESLEIFLNEINGWVWGLPLLILLFGTHIFLTFRLGFVQRHIGKAIRLSLQPSEGAGDVSQFGSLMTALAATIGTGNIVGVSTAVAAGGPGAVLWMWLTGVFGMATKYAEALLAVKYRIVNEHGEMAGGPMYVIERGLGLKSLAAAFAVFTAIAAFGIGNVVQANSLAALAHDTFGIATWVTGLVLTVITGLVVLRGIQSIARTCRYLVPFMAIYYVLGCIIILIINIGAIPAALGLIFESAFNGQAAVGGFLGAGLREAVRMGISRGLFSNESGMGSAPIVAAAAKTKNPVHQALVSMTGTFWDTVVICALTGLVVVVSGEWQSGLRGAALTKSAFGTIPVIGPAVLTLGLAAFVFSTLLGWSYFGEKAVEYLFGLRAILPYRWAWTAAVMIGSVATLDIVWAFADIANGLMAIPNLISLLLLNRVLAAETREYADRPDV